MSSGKPVQIVRVIRRMRGGSQSFLVRGGDGWCYVAKFADNPQGNRTLINECMASHLLSCLGVAVPDLAILRLDESCERREDLYFSMERQVPIISGLHLGSKCPVDPDEVAIFDFLPRTLLTCVKNLDDLGVVFAFDQWVAHIDTRQFIFARRPNPLNESSSKQRGGSFYKAWAIDNGMCFGGDWTFASQNLYAYHPFLDVYSSFDLKESACRGAQQIQSLPASEIEAACQHIPREWFGQDDEIALDAMLATLRQRQEVLVDCILGHVDAVAATKQAGQTPPGRAVDLTSATRREPERSRLALLAY